ncbi:unnamed protein product [Microthlaspi erraticum]|uniref:Protein kinase domain-containing protein n=1 Tax=Microthlaspi erraticum TaxID=1685480 RepID=A0A6D2JIE3_9BRAS|nr:unnamed protein product [Microthlaspi erraticum]
MGNSLNPFKEQPLPLAYDSLTTPLLISEEAENDNVRVFSVTELKKATKRFKVDRQVLGMDGCVRKFYKGKGYIDGSRTTSVEEEKALPWETRIKIAIGTAQGLIFFHSIKNSPLNRELRMHNIMLDEQYNAKLFYLESEQQYVVNRTIYGEEWIYMAPEFLISGYLGTDTDVYTFGVILLELLAGSEDRARKLFKISPDGWIRPFFIGEIIDPRLGNDYPVKAAIELGTLIQSCTMMDKKKRPVMQHVLDVLNIIAEIEFYPSSFAYHDIEDNLDGDYEEATQAEVDAAFAALYTDIRASLF